MLDWKVCIFSSIIPRQFNYLSSRPYFGFQQPILPLILIVVKQFHNSFEIYLSCIILFSFVFYFFVRLFGGASPFITPLNRLVYMYIKINFKHYAFMMRW